MKFDRLQVMDDLEELQEKVEDMGFAGSNEFELHFREEIADYIMKLSNQKQIDLTLKNTK